MTRSVVDALDAVDWRADRVVLPDLVLRLQPPLDNVGIDVPSLAFFKSKSQIDTYRSFFASRPDFAPRRVFELGIWDGGSTAFWYEMLEPSKLIAVDIADRVDNPLFARYIEARDAGSRVETHWCTNQEDAPRLRELAGRLAGPIDMVIDDASHWYVPTRSSFETLFPLVRPGGMYVIEDWPWAHLPEYRDPDHTWYGQTPLTRLVHDLVELQGSSPDLVAGITVTYALVAIERGAAEPDPAGFDLDAYIVRSE